MCCNAVILGNGHINQLIKTIGADKVETFPELGIKTTTKVILLLGIRVCMMTGILAQMIKDLCILKHSMISLSKRQELIQFMLQESLGNMMRPEGGPEFFPTNDIVGGQHGTIIIPPDAGGAT